MEYKLENKVYHTTNVWRNAKGVFEFCVWAPFVEKMYVEIRPSKHLVINEDVEFSEHWTKMWHIDAKTDDKKSVIIELKKDEDNCFRGTTPKWKVINGDMYRFILEKNGVKKYSKDPRSICQPHIFSWSKLYDNNRYNWSSNEKKWQRNEIKEKLSVKDKNLLQLHNFAYIEAHIPTATDEGTLTAFKDRIDEIAAQGFKGILLMPAEGTYDINWGYDGVDKYAITRAWGKDLVKDDVTNIDKVNDNLKSLVDYAHQKHLNVGIDWVPSHITEEFGNNLLDFGPYENINKEENACAKTWGGFTFNLEGCKNLPINDNVKQVRRYIADIPLHLIESYHFDFIRGDQSPNMYSNRTMKLVKAEIDYYFPDVAVIWEDHRICDRLTEKLSPEEIDNSDAKKHQKSIEQIMINDTSLCNIGGDEIWDFNFSHALEANIMDRDIWPAQANVEYLSHYFDPNFKGTKYLLSHDEIGNHCGSRILTKYIASKLKLNQNAESPIKRHCHTSDCARTLLECGLYSKNFDLFNINSINQILEFYFVKKNTVTPEVLRKVLKEAIAFDKLGHACVYLASGSKMIFQGENYGEINPFLFHRIQPVSENAISLCKGYDIGKIGFYRSKLDKECHFLPSIYNFFKEINKLCTNGEFLTNEKFEIRKIHNADKILAFERIAKDGRRLLAFLNFSTQPKVVELALTAKAPERYIELLNTDSSSFGGLTPQKEDLVVNKNFVTKLIPPATAIVYKGSV